MIQRGIVLFLLSVLTVITQVFAGSLTNDPFVQSSIDRSNFEPGGQYHLFGAPRGGTTDREGRINVLPVYDQQLGSLRLENVVVDGDITYNTRFSGHHWDEHAPFSETSSQSKSTEEGSIADGFTVLKLNWSGTKVHPADGYDGEQGGGYPVPTGARDEYHYTINGNAQRISLQLNDQRSTSQRFLDRFSQAGKDFVDGANQSHDKFFINDPRLNTWGNIAQGFNGLVDAALSPLRPISDLLGVHDAADGLSALAGYSTLAGMSGLSADGKGSAIDALAAANGFKNDIVDATHDWALNHPNSIEGMQAATNIVSAGISNEIKGGISTAESITKPQPTNSLESYSTTTKANLKANYAAQEIQGATPVGSALKEDPHHIAPSFIPTEDIANNGSHFTIMGGDGQQYNLTQMVGDLNDQPGVYEWLTKPSTGELTHQRFIPNGVITGKPNQIVKKPKAK